ncbi:MAG: branched-chain amino acid ABC transporter permease [Deltaproteobacteria bacterium]|nr:MAG: branched-chain amino acid ABC transporter permease [Deltaproteobacteria bacterium]
MFVTFLDVVIGGLIMGGIYALIAVGLSLQYGVGRVLNISHGEFIMLGAFATWTLYTILGISPLISLVICGPGMFIIGFFIHRTLFQYLRGKSESIGAFADSSLLASFGLLFIIQNIALITWKADIRGYSYLESSVSILGAMFAANRLVALLFAVVISLAFYFFLTRARLGKAIRAAAEDPETAQVMGVNIHRVLAICFGLGALMAGFAGVLISMMYEMQPNMGIEYTIIAIIVVVLGGLGSITGSLIGGFLLGLIGSIVTYFDAGLSLIAYYVIFILLLLVRPTGIFGK